MCKTELLNKIFDLDKNDSAEHRIKQIFNIRLHPSFCFEVGSYILYPVLTSKWERIACPGVAVSDSHTWVKNIKSCPGVVEIVSSIARQPLSSTGHQHS